MVVELISPRDQQRAKALVESASLSFEERYDNLVGVFSGTDLVAVGARHGSVLKMLVIAPAFQGESLLGEIVTELIRLGYQAGEETFFVFTPPKNIGSFAALNFRLLIRHHRIALLEYGGGLARYLEGHRHLVRSGENGAVVVNCNPFTLGHRYLIEEAARQVDYLYLFVVREDHSAFSFATRYQLVAEGVRDLPNVILLDTAYYAVSSVTFPGYFLQRWEDATMLQIEIDLLLFAKELAPFFGIRRRFVGTEPYCRTTRIYSETMKRILKSFRIETVQLERRKHGEEPISAFRVRQAIRNEAYESLRKMVPPTTLDFLLSEEGQAVRERLLNVPGRH